MVEKLDAKVEAAKGEKRVELMQKIAKLNAQNRQLRGMNYSPVMAEWFEEMYDIVPIKVGNIFSANPLKQRKTISYQSLLDAGLPIKSLNAQDLMLNYVNRVSRKYAILKIRQAAISDGAMTSNVKIAQKKGYYPVSAMSMPLFKGLYGDGRLIQYLQEMQTGYVKGGSVRSVLSNIKGMQFLNPAYLGLNNVKQEIMLGSYANLKLPKYLASAIKSLYHWDKEFYAAKAHGISGSPMGDTVRSWNEKSLESKFPLAKRAMRMALKNMLPSKANAYGIRNLGGAGSLMKNLYEMSHNLAWSFDTLTRMVSYHYLRDIGYGQRESAQMAAMFHGDYSSVPLKLRRQMTLALFTPTYKVAMSKLYLSMMTGATETLTAKGKTAWFDSEMGPELKKDKKKARILGRGLFYMMAVIYGFDQFMQHEGWTRDKLGWKYTREIETAEGSKEIVFVENGAENLLIKTMLKLYASIDNKDGEPFVKSLIKSFKYELHPALRAVVFDMSDNRKGDGSYIYHVGDDPEIKMLKSAEYLAKQWVRALALLDPDEAQKETNKVLNEQFGKAMGLLMRSSVFTYIRARKKIRAAGRMKRLMKTIISQAYSDKHGPSPEQLKNLEGMMRDLAEEAK
ncbi:MAG: hypothetical protein DRI37_08765 [Chloroflexi bacterium]|nr:MAG: hypothetical protein DRI37_08765 [Chloroflexota bacterium]